MSVTPIRTLPTNAAFAADPLESMGARRAAAEFLAVAGVELGGDRPFDIRVHDPRAYSALFAGTLAFGEAYMNGWWDCDAVDQLTARVFAHDLARDPPTLPILVRAAVAALTNRQSPTRAFEVAKTHYDAGTDVFAAMLDENLVYTCADWKDATDLAGAQIAKMDLVCRKLEFEPGMRVLDIGCGFGSFMKYACERYGVECVGYSVSTQQMATARVRCAGLPIQLELADYRALPAEDRFDRIVSIGMLEAVGYKNYRTFAEVVARALAPSGLALIQTVGSNTSTRRGDPWIDKYIFPNGMLPSIAQIGSALEGLLVMEDWHNLGADYDRTLMAWNARFQAAWPALSLRYPNRFKRMWELYLLSFAGGFRARTYQLWQILLSKPGRPQPARRRG